MLGCLKCFDIQVHFRIDFFYQSKQYVLNLGYLRKYADKRKKVVTGGGKGLRAIPFVEDLTRVLMIY